MRKRGAAIAGLGVTMLVVAVLIAGGVLTPGSTLPAWFVPGGAVIVALGLILAGRGDVGRGLAGLTALVAVVASWASDLPLVKATVLATGGAVMLAIAWHGRRPSGRTD